MGLMSHLKSTSHKEPEIDTRSVSSFSTMESNIKPQSLIFSIKPAAGHLWSVSEARLTGSSPLAAPMYSIATEGKLKPTVSFSRGAHNSADPSSLLANGRVHSTTPTVDVTMNNQPISIKMSQLSGNITAEGGSQGKMKWTVSKLTGKMELHDHSGTKLAVIIPRKMTREKKMEILVPGDESYMDWVMLTGMVGTMLVDVAIVVVASAGAS